MDAIILFTKVPMANFSKTRMMPQLDSAQCENLQKILLLDTKREIDKQKTADLFIFYTPENQKEKLDNILNEERYFTQKGSDIFEKMENAFEEVFDLGYKKVVLVGSDIFDLREKDIESAFFVLDTKDIVIGSTFDKGYYLIGMKSLHKIFSIPNTQEVFEATLENIKNAKLSYGEIGRKRDLDDIEDLQVIKKFEKSEELQKFINSLDILWR